jgi:hypothetical protein
MLTGTRDGQTTFTTESKTIKLSSEHFGSANKMIQPEGFSLEYRPTGADSMRVAYKTDNHATHGFTVNLNPYSYAVINTSTGFVLDTDSLVSPDDIYTYYHPLPCEQGKTFELTITSSGEVDTHITGMEITAKLAEGAAYVGGVA